MPNFRYCILGMDDTEKITYVNKIRNFNVSSNVFSILSEKDITNYSEEKPNLEIYYRNDCSLHYNHNLVLEFQVKYYSGMILKNKDENFDSQKNLQADLEKTDFLIIIVNGDYFVQDDKEAIIKLLKRKCVRFLNPFIAYCSEQQENIWHRKQHKCLKNMT